MYKIKSLEGFRIFAALSVVLYHFRGAFFPNSQLGLIDQTPLRILTAGNPVVRMLFVLSGFVVSYKYLILKKDYDNIPADMLKRYVRLAPPIIVAQLLVCFMMKAGLLFNVHAGNLSGSSNFLAQFNNFTPTWLSCIKEGLISCYLRGGTIYIGPLWTMVYEYLGVLLVLSVLYICKSRRLRLLFYGIFLSLYSSYYNYFILGMVLCELYGEEEITGYLRTHSIFNTVLFAGSFFVVSMLNLDDTFKVNRIVFAVSTLIFFLTLMNSSWGERILGNRMMEKGGQLSYAVYIVHWPIIESFSSALYIWMYRQNGGVSGYLSLLNLVLTLILIFLVAAFFQAYIEKIGQGAANYIAKHPVP
ncbi:MAG: acyltransferase [Hungatella sp.]|nr:acyltransferase [Hungatella sp.]